MNLLTLWRQLRCRCHCWHRDDWRWQTPRTERVCVQSGALPVWIYRACCHCHRTERARGELIERSQYGLPYEISIRLERGAKFRWVLRPSFAPW